MPANQLTAIVVCIDMFLCVF